MVLKVCCLGFQVRLNSTQLWTLPLLRVDPFVESLPVAGLNEEDLLEAVRERLREDYADVFGDRDRDQKRQRPAESTGRTDGQRGPGGIWMMAESWRSWFSISLETIRGGQNAGSQWVYLYIYTYIIHYYTWYINLFIFYEGSPLDLCCSLFCSVLARPKPSQILYRR